MRRFHILILQPQIYFMGGKTVGKGTVSVVIYHAVVTAEGCKAESPEIRFKVLGKVKGVYAVISIEA